MTKQGVKEAEKSAAWVDDDDEEVKVSLVGESRAKKLRTTEAEVKISGAEYSRRLHQQFERLHRRPKWAQVQDGPADEPGSADEDSVMRDPFSLLRARDTGQRAPLLPDVIAVRRYRNANFVNSSKSHIVALDTHPTKPWILAAGRDQQVHIFEVDCLENKLLFSLKIQEWRTLSARFAADGCRVFISGTGPSILVWHMDERRVDKVPLIPGRRETKWPSLKVSHCGRFLAMEGDDGYIVVLSARTLQLCEAVKMNGRVLDFDFSEDGSMLVSVGADSKIYVWSTKDYSCVKVVSEHSGTVCTSVAISPGASYLAVGSNMGIVSLYDLSDLLASTTPIAKPFRTLLNLTTSITSIAFHQSSELLAFGSDDRNTAFRLVHLPSGRVFSNWPKETTHMSKVQKITFDTSGRLMFIGNDKGQVLTYGIRHFE